MIFHSIANAYRQFGAHGAGALVRYYVLRVVTTILGPGRECPVCGWKGREFIPLLLQPEGTIRPRAICPGCGAWERQRWMGHFVEQVVARAFGSRKPDVIHISPERCLEPLLRRISSRYRRSDYEKPEPGDLQLDLQNLSLEDESVDAFLMNGVLTCVPDDMAAIASMYRKLRPGGIVFAIEPIGWNATTESWGEQGYRFSFRRYGSSDLAQRFAPFSVDLDGFARQITDSERERFGLFSVDAPLLLRKPPVGC